MIRTLDFNAFAAGTVIDDEYLASDGVTVSATGPVSQAMIFDSNNPTGGDEDLASDTLDGLLIISEDGDGDDPDDNASGGSIFFDFEDIVRIKSLTFKDIEETSGEGTRMIFYDDDGNVIDNQFVDPTGDNGERTVGIFVEGVSRMEVRFEGSGAIDNLVFDDGQPQDDGPTAVDDEAITDEDIAIVIDIRGNDTDPNNTNDELTIGGFDSPNGTVVDNGDGTVTFTPDENFNGDTSFTYTVTDPDGNSDTGEVFVEVLPVNDAPDAVDDSDTTDFETPITVDLLANDSDVDGDDLRVVSATVPEAQGTLVDNGDGTVTFTPAAGFVGAATIDYTIEDTGALRDSAEHVITVEEEDDPGGNNAPTASNDLLLTTPFETTLEDIPVLDNDEDIDGDPLRIVDATSPDGDVTINPDGTLNFTPNPGFSGDAEISYTISDRPDGDPDGLTDDAVAFVSVGEPTVRDGIVDGTPDDDLIDVDYDGDPDGDFIDNEDAIIPGEEPNDDIVRAGDGDDTVIAGEGSDEVDGGDGDDDISTGNGDIAPDDGYPFAPGVDPLGYDPDTDPDNDRDFVDGGAGNDTISTGDDADTIIGGDGDDVINGGIDDDEIDGNADDDRIVGGEGDDTIRGGSGNDTIYAGNDPELIPDVVDIPDEETDGFPFSPDRNPDNGRDFVEGGAGDDLIFGADDDDTLNGGSGNDTIDGQIDDDIINGNGGDDSLIGGQGDDSLRGGQGEDTVEGGDGDDTVRGNRGDDILMGGDGDDSLDGGGENDLLEGGDGDDDMMGGQGNDTLDGGAGIDTMTGGAGQDTFINVNAGDDVDGGSGPVDFDTLDLRGSAPEGGRLEITYTSDDREDGFVTYFNAEDEELDDRLVFEEIENVIPCFTPGTKIATPKGERLVEELKVGDRVITRDNGIQEIRWVGAKEMTGAEFERAQHLKPVLIQQGALGNDLPERDMMVSPNHRVLVANDKTALYFEEREVLVAAKHLTGLEGVDIVEVSSTTYIHIMFDQHEVILSDGSWTESFQPGDMSLAGIGNAQRQEILELFPELATQEGIEGYASARRSLKKHEAKLLTK